MDRCAYCGDTGGPFHLDHVVPRSRGGQDHPRNIVRACQACNLAKGDRLPSEWLSHVPPRVRELEQRASAVVAKRVRRKGAVDSRPAPRLACDECGRDLFANWDNAHLGWWRRYRTTPSEVVDVALYCTGPCYRQRNARNREAFGDGVMLSDLPVESFFGRWAWLELASLLDGCSWPRPLLQKLVGILRQCSKLEPDEQPPFVAEEGDDPTMVDD
jgi:hypothetical protein